MKDERIRIKALNYLHYDVSKKLLTQIQVYNKQQLSLTLSKCKKVLNITLLKGEKTVLVYSLLVKLNTKSAGLTS